MTETSSTETSSTGSSTPSNGAGGADGIYQGYLYAYPHKSAYRVLASPRSLPQVWAGEDRSALFAYVHIPFCEMRCGFCNLFTVARPPRDLPAAYLQRLTSQINTTVAALGDDTRFARLAIGGGTPTLLEAGQLAALFAALKRSGIDPATIPASIESSPATATPDRLAVLAEVGIARVSIGIQTFDDAESKRLARPQPAEQAHGALEGIVASGVPELNIDLIYGIENQTERSFIDSIDQALTYRPAEIYLYPLYVRPLTGLGLSTRAWDDQRAALYRTGRDHLVAAGYTQLSMRVFRRLDAPLDAPDYSCQDDGMVGFGAGARSYTRDLHYSSDFAVSRPEVAGIVDAYIDHPGGGDSIIDYGVQIDEDEQQRRYVIKSILRTSGLDGQRFEARFGSAPLVARPELQTFIANGWLRTDRHRLIPTAEGLAASDVMGPALISPAILALGQEFDLR